MIELEIRLVSQTVTEARITLDRASTRCDTCHSIPFLQPVSRGPSNPASLRKCGGHRVYCILSYSNV